MEAGLTDHVWSLEELVGLLGISSGSSPMTQEDEDKIAGQTRREYREAKHELAALQSKARKLGERMTQVGNLLANAPETLTFNQESHDPRFQPALNPLATTGEFAEVHNLLPLTNQIRAAILRVDKLRQELTRLEGEDPEGGDPGVYNSPPRPHFIG
jgi:hypothetical protein